MKAVNLHLWALIQAQIVQVEAMKAANVTRSDQGYAQAYDEKAFVDVQKEIERLAHIIDFIPE